MRSRTRVPSRPHSSHAGVGFSKEPLGLASIATTGLLAALLVSGPLVLGAARLWFELPLLGVVALVLLIQGLRLQGKPSVGSLRQIDAIDFSVVIFVLYAVGRWLTSPTEYFSRIEAMTILAYAIVFFTCRYGLARRTQGLTLLFLLVAVGVFETGFGYYFCRHSDLNDPQSLWFPFGETERLQLHYYPRWVGTYGCPNHYGAILVMAIATALTLGSFSKLSWPVRIVFFYLSVMMMIGVMYSGSRGSWLGALTVIIALAVFGVRYAMLRWWVPIVGALVPVAVFAVAFSLSPFAQDRLAEIKDIYLTGRWDENVRIELAKDALHIAHDSPVFGTGPATFVFIHPRYQDGAFAFKAVLTHDDYLNCLDDYGLVGFAIVMFFVAAVTLKFFTRIRADSRWQDRVLVAAGFTAWSALLVHSWLDFNMHIPANAFMLFALTGMGLRRLSGELESTHWSSVALAPLGRWPGWALIVLSLGYGYLVWRTAASDITYEEAFAKAADVPTIQSIQSIEDALAFDPDNAQALVFLGDLYRYRASRQTEIEDRVVEGQKALTAYQQALKANPLDDTVEGRMGLTFDVMRRYSEAYFCYKVAADAQPYNGQFWYYLGNHFWQRGLLEKAEQAYLIAAQCPHGFEGSADAAREVRGLLNAKGISAPAPGANPLEPKPRPEEPPTTP